MTRRFAVLLLTLAAAAVPATRPGEWGEPVEGVRASLKVERGRGKVADLAFTAGVRNDGKRTDLMVAKGQEFLEIEVDGKWYQWVADQSGQAIALPPGKELAGVRVSLDGEWRPIGHDAKLKPTRGRHALRVRFLAENEQEFEPVLPVVSNKVEFDVLE
jgi:hypothetical protein